MTEERQQEIYAETVVPLIIENGKSIKLIQPNKGVYDDVTGYPPSTPIEYNGYGLETEATSESVPSSIVEKASLTLLCVEIPEPVVDVDTIEVNSTEYKVLFVDPLQPGNVVFYYEVYLGR